MKELTQSLPNLEVKPNVFYTPCEVAELMRVSPKSITNMLNKGLAPAVKIGRQWRILGRDLLELSRADDWDDRKLIQSANRLAQPVLSEIWDNEEDAIYDNL